MYCATHSDRLSKLPQITESESQHDRARDYVTITSDVHCAFKRSTSVRTRGRALNVHALHNSCMALIVRYAKFKHPQGFHYGG